ncbi:MAG: hypothetical protein WCG27_13585, partial [Pseudomonadota bacterium]
QGLCFYLLGYAAWRGSMPIILLFIIVTFYWSCGMGAGPAWTTWIHSLIPTVLQAKFFSRRSVLIYLGNFLGLGLAGFSLHYGKQEGFVLHTFMAIFFFAGSARLISTFFLTRQSEIRGRTHDMQFIGLRKFFKELPEAFHIKMILFVVTLKATVYIAAPYFNPFMLSQLKMPYQTYMMVVGSALLGSVFILVFPQSFARREKMEKMMFWASLGVAINPALWLISHNTFFLMLIQVWSGLVWGIFELCLFLFLFNDIPEKKQTSILSVYSFIQTLFIVSGSILGGIFLKALGKTELTYHSLFIVSSILRFAAIFLLFPRKSKKMKLTRVSLL